MKCQKCNSLNTRVTCTNHFDGFTKRYCRCLDCCFKYRTIERYEYIKPGPPKGVLRSGNIVRGESHGQSVLTASNVIEIRQMRSKGITLAKIAVKFGITPTYVSRIVNRKNWTHI